MVARHGRGGWRGADAAAHGQPNGGSYVEPDAVSDAGANLSSNTGSDDSGSDPCADAGAKSGTYTGPAAPAPASLSPSCRGWLISGPVPPPPDVFWDLSF